MPASKPDYTSFLLRLWRDSSPMRWDHTADGEWLVQVEHIPTGEKRYFASLEELFAFIRAQVASISAKRRSRDRED